MISKEKAQAVIDAIRKVCNEHGVVIYGSSIGESMPAEIVIESSDCFIGYTRYLGNLVIDWHGPDYLYANSIGDFTANKTEVN